MKVKVKVKKGRKRRLAGWTLIALGLLVVGAVTTAGIACAGPWLELAGGATGRGEGLVSIQTVGGGAATGNCARFATFRRVAVGELSLSTTPPPPLTEDELDRLFVPTGISHISWSPEHLNRVEQAKSQRVTRAYRAGWPAQVLRWRESFAGPASGIGAMKREPGGWGLDAGAAAINTAFWSAAIGAVVGLVHWGRLLFYRLLRHAQGCCAHCGYSLKGLAPDAPCPECGTVRSGAKQMNAGSEAARSNGPPQSNDGGTK